MIKGILVTEELNMVAEFIEIAFVANVEHEFPDVQTQSTLPSKSELIEFFIIALNVSKLGATVDINVPDGTGLKSERAKFEAQ